MFPCHTLLCNITECCDVQLVNVQPRLFILLCPTIILVTINLSAESAVSSFAEICQCGVKKILYFLFATISFFLRSSLSIHTVQIIH